MKYSFFSNVSIFIKCFHGVQTKFCTPFLGIIDMMIFYLIRHGLTESNKEKIVMGQGDSPLSNEGIEDACYLGEKLKHIQFNSIYSSDLGRARNTADIIAHYLIGTPPINFKPELREINFGRYNNTPRSVMKQQFSSYGRDVSFIYPDGESLLIMQERVCNFITGLEKKHADDIILLVSHSAVIKGIISRFTKVHLQAFYDSQQEISHRYIGRFTIKGGTLLGYGT